MVVVFAVIVLFMYTFAIVGSELYGEQVSSKLLCRADPDVVAAYAQLEAAVLRAGGVAPPLPAPPPAARHMAAADNNSTTTDLPACSSIPSYVDPNLRLATFADAMMVRWSFSSSLAFAFTHTALCTTSTRHSSKW